MEHIPEKIKLADFRPMRNLLLIKLYPQGMESVNGILMPASSDPDFIRARVVKVGPGTRTMSGELIPIDAKENDQILIPGNLEKSLRKIRIEDEEYLLIEETSVLAIA